MRGEHAYCNEQHTQSNIHNDLIHIELWLCLCNHGRDRREIIWKFIKCLFSLISREHPEQMPTLTEGNR